MDVNAFVIVRGIACVLISLVALYVIPYIKTKFSQAQLQEIITWVNKAVACAEIIFDAPKSGDDKRKYVTDFIYNQFNKHKEVITEEQIRVLLEDAVARLKSSN